MPVQVLNLSYTYRGTLSSTKVVHSFLEVKTSVRQHYTLGEDQQIHVNLTLLALALLTYLELTKELKVRGQGEGLGRNFNGNIGI